MSALHHPELWHRTVVLLLTVVLNACGTMPFPNEHKLSQPSPPSPEPKGGDTIIVEPDPPPKPPVEIPIVDPLSAQDHSNNAMTALQNGQEANAKAHVEAALRQDPDNKIAKSLMAQIQADPAEYFGGQDFFNYTVQPGDSLSSIARRFLDDPLKFHILAKFGGITDPSHLQPGQIIKLPGKRPVEVSSPIPWEPSRLAQAKRFYDAGKYQEVIVLLEGGNTSGEGRDLWILSSIKYADELTQKANLIEAQNIIEKALLIQPGNDKLKKQLKLLERQREIVRLYKAGTDALAAHDKPKALDAFKAVLRLDPTHEAAKKQIANIQSGAVEIMYKDAMTEFRKQNLDKAIDLWDRVLILDPNHEWAKMYRAQAVELKVKFDNLIKK